MKLVKARVGNFKSIDDSDEFTFDHVTCLVGKNEAGKTAVLEALYKLNPVENGTGDFGLEEYPRKRLAKDRKRMMDEPATVVRTQWELEDHDVQSLDNSSVRACSRALRSGSTRGTRTSGSGRFLSTRAASSNRSLPGPT